MEFLFRIIICLFALLIFFLILWWIRKRDQPPTSGLLGFFVLAVALLYLGIIYPDYFSFGGLEIKKEITQLKQDLIQYAIIDVKKNLNQKNHKIERANLILIKSTFGNSLELGNYNLEEKGFTFIFKKKPRFLEVRSSRGTNWYAKLIEEGDSFLYQAKEGGKMIVNFPEDFEYDQIIIQAFFD
jgi:hypothetical protein